ncbi:helix-turn-helix transcriptional regulator [Mycobacterium sp. SMC-4]|uniref:helix-turn-helix transcriptional regulator n=1 Tax=Mycobacterium sp. SMC-4 TaxID=2857059 RepID=UPI0021B184C1|nr:helix-turn-helix transcriptional regulator [Mycobacterium sp. SMC-4]UXA20262.1 helix-turn-helix transcriptional regulator [Mycobacterium sp. SMC-4]
MSAQSESQAELGAFLRARRQRISRETYGLPARVRGRGTGLRREEVSALCGVSITWYTWLEQGRSITPSRQVLDAIARTLQLSPTEHHYLLGLAGYAPATDPARIQPAPDHIQRLLDALGDRPAYVLAGDWSIVGWNAAYAQLYPTVAVVGAEERNLLWLVFTDPSVRTLLDDWELTSTRFLAEFRAEVAGRLSDPPIRDLLDRLHAASVEFRHGWDAHPIAGFESRERVFHHPTAGLLRLEHHQLRPSDRPDLQLVVYTPYSV